MTGDLEPGPHRPVEMHEDEALQVPSLRLDELERLRAEVARLSAQQGQPPAAQRTTRLGPWKTTRADAAQPLRTAATEDRRRAAADVVLGLRALGAVGLAVVGTLAVLVVLTVLFGLWRLAARFAVWSSNGSAVLGGLLLFAASIGIVAAGLWLFLRLTDRRRSEL